MNMSILVYGFFSILLWENVFNPSICLHNSDVAKNIYMTTFLKLIHVNTYM